MADFSNYPNFAKKEFSHGGPPMHSEFMAKLQKARTIAENLCKEEGLPEHLAYFIINSGSRSEERNRQVGGKPDSTHLHGRACDIAANSSRSRYIITKSLLLAGFTRVGIANSFIHVDDGELVSDEKPGHPKPEDVIWLYS